MRQLIEIRHPIYAMADLTVDSHEAPHDRVVADIIGPSQHWLDATTERHGVTTAAARRRMHPAHHRSRPARRSRLRHRRRAAACSARRAHASPRLAPGTAAIVTDGNVGPLYAADARRRPRSSTGLRTSVITVAPGEATKSYASLETVCDAMLAARIERGDLVMALGGGVVGDLAGFAAAVVRRGVRFVQVPTTLLCPGRFLGRRQDRHQLPPRQEPRRRLSPAEPRPRRHRPSRHACRSREMRAGYAEVAKYGLIDDAPFFAWCESNWRGVFAGGRSATRPWPQSCRAKADGRRARRARGGRPRAAQSRPHLRPCARADHAATTRRGSCTARASRSGIGLAFRFSASSRPLPRRGRRARRRHLPAVGLPTRLQDVPGGPGTVDGLLDAMAQDKKVKARRADLHPRPRNRQELHRAAASPSRRCGPFLKRREHPGSVMTE